MKTGAAARRLEVAHAPLLRAGEGAPSRDRTAATPRASRAAPWRRSPRRVRPPGGCGRAARARPPPSRCPSRPAPGSRETSARRAPGSRTALEHLRRAGHELTERARLAHAFARAPRVVALDPQRRAADGQLRAGRQLDLGDPVRPHPRAVRASGVANVHTVAHAAQREVHAAHLGIAQTRSFVGWRPAVACVLDIARARPAPGPATATMRGCPPGAQQRPP